VCRKKPLNVGPPTLTFVFVKSQHGIFPFAILPDSFDSVLESKGGQANRKSENSWAKFRNRKSAYFLGEQARKSQFSKFYDLSANRKSANFYKILHNTVSKQS
jgi:hypothetical protein